MSSAEQAQRMVKVKQYQADLLGYIESRIYTYLCIEGVHWQPYHSGFLYAELRIGYSSAHGVCGRLQELYNKCKVKMFPQDTWKSPGTGLWKYHALLVQLVPFPSGQVRNFNLHDLGYIYITSDLHDLTGPFIYFYFSMEMYVVDSHQKCLAEASLMSTHNIFEWVPICFCEEIRKVSILFDHV